MSYFTNLRNNSEQKPVSYEDSVTLHYEIYKDISNQQLDLFRFLHEIKDKQEEIINEKDDLLDNLLKNVVFDINGLKVALAQNETAESREIVLLRLNLENIRIENEELKCENRTLKQNHDNIVKILMESNVANESVQTTNIENLNFNMEQRIIDLINEIERYKKLSTVSTKELEKLEKENYESELLYLKNQFEKVEEKLFRNEIDLLEKEETLKLMSDQLKIVQMEFENNKLILEDVNNDRLKIDEELGNLKAICLEKEKQLLETKYNLESALKENEHYKEIETYNNNTEESKILQILLTKVTSEKEHGEIELSHLKSKLDEVEEKLLRNEIDLLKKEETLKLRSDQLKVVQMEFEENKLILEDVSNDRLKCNKELDNFKEICLEKEKQLVEIKSKLELSLKVNENFEEIESVNNSTEELKILQFRLAKVTSEKEDCEMKLSDLKSKLDEVEEKVLEYEVDLLEKDKLQKSMEDQLKTVQIKLDKSELSLKDVNDDHLKLGKELDNLKSICLEKEEKIVQVNNNLKLANEKVLLLTKSTEELEIVRMVLETIKSEKEKCELELSSVKSKLNEVEEKVLGYEIDILEKDELLKSMEDQLKMVQIKLDKSELSLKNVKDELDNLNSIFYEKEEQLVQINNDLKLAHEKILLLNKSAEELEIIRNVLETIKSEKEKCELELSSVKSKLDEVEEKVLGNEIDILEKDELMKSMEDQLKIVQIKLDKSELSLKDLNEDRLLLCEEIDNIKLISLKKDEQILEIKSNLELALNEIEQRNEIAATDNASEELESLRSDIKILASEKENCEVELSSLRSKLVIFEESFLRNEIDSLEKEEKLKILNDQLKMVQKQLEEKDLKLKATIDDHVKLNEELDNLKSVCLEKEEQFLNVDNNLKFALNENQMIQEEKNSCLILIEEQTVSIKQFQNDLKISQKENTNLRDNLKELCSEKENITNQYKKIQDEINELKGVESILVETLSKSRDELKEKEKENQYQIESLEKLIIENNSLQTKLSISLETLCEKEKIIGDLLISKEELIMKVNNLEEKISETCKSKEIYDQLMEKENSLKESRKELQLKMEESLSNLKLSEKKLKESDFELRAWRNKFLLKEKETDSFRIKTKEITYQLNQKKKECLELTENLRICELNSREENKENGTRLKRELETLKLELEKKELAMKEMIPMEKYRKIYDEFNKTKAQYLKKRKMTEDLEKKFEALKTICLENGISVD